VGSELNVKWSRTTFRQRFATSNSDAALPNVPSHPPQGYGFGGGTQSHTRTRTPAYPGPIPAWVSIPVSITIDKPYVGSFSDLATGIEIDKTNGVISYQGKTHKFTPVFHLTSDSWSDWVGRKSFERLSTAKMVGIAPLVIFLLFFVSPSSMKPLYTTQVLLIVVTAHRCLLFPSFWSLPPSIDLSSWNILQLFAKRLAVADLGNLKTNKTKQTLS